MTRHVTRESVVVVALACISVAASLAACSKVKSRLSAVTESPRIRGVVRDLAGEPVEGVTVIASGQAFRATTDKDGKYELEYTPGRLMVRFTKDGFAAEPLTFDLAAQRPVAADPAVLVPIPRDDDPFVYVGGRLAGLTRREVERIQDPPVVGAAPNPRGAKPFHELRRVGLATVKDAPKVVGKPRILLRSRRGLMSPSAVDNDWTITRLTRVGTEKLTAPALGPTAAVLVKINLHVPDKDMGWRARAVPRDDPQVFLIEPEEQPTSGSYAFHQGVLRAERPLEFSSASREQLRVFLFEVELPGYAQTPDRFPDRWVDGSGQEIEAHCTVTASSILSAKYIPRLVRDGRMETGWCEDAKGPGLGEWVKLDWSKPIIEPGLWLTPGWFRGMEAWRKNNRLREARFETSTGENKVQTFPDEAKPVQVALKPGFTWVKLTILSVHPREFDKKNKDDDTCISEISPVRIPERPLPP
ncbi:MAG: carboxypeptidase regulatory-like domain-containing protein [Deltaproteobacteria bacterium]|nr:carboxypeptidase regulatory-like domain-containing protein [Deltaproteobacteria bacterium]